MNQIKLIGVSQDNNYLFTNNGVYITKGEGGYVKYTESLPYLVEIAQDNNDYEFTKGIISLTEYSLKPRKILSILLESLPFNESLSILKEWDNKFGNKLLITESDNSESVKKIVSESFGEIKSLVSEQNTYSTAVDITNKIIDALSQTFNDDEQEALNQVKRINSADLLSNVEKVIKSKKKMSLIDYLNSEMSDVDWEYKSIYNHLKNIQSSYSKGYQENKFYQAAGKGIDVAKSGISLVGKGLSKALEKIILPIIKKGIIPLMRWIRRNAYTTIGIVVDVITAMLPITTGINKTIWGLIVFLDLYEIIAGDFDTEDPERNSNPYMFLIIDLIAFLFTSVAGTAAKVALKSGGKIASSATGKLLKSLLNKLPGLKNILSEISSYVTKHLPGLSKIVQFVFKGIDKIILGVETFIKQLFSKRGVVAVGAGVAIAGFFKERNLKLGDSGNDVLGVNQYFSEYHNIMWPECKINDNVVNSLKKDGNKFTKNTEISVKTFEGCIIKKPEYKDVIKDVDGQINGYELGLYTDVEMDDRGVITKYIPHSAKDKFQKTIGGIMGFLAKNAETALNAVTNKNSPPNTNSVNKTTSVVPKKPNNTKNQTSDLRKELDSFFQSNQ